MKFQLKNLAILALPMALLVAGCGSGGGSSTTTAPGTTASGTEGPAGTPSNLKGEIKVDGSSTVFKISQAMAEEFNLKHKDVSVSVSESGTGGGFKKFVAGEIDIANASRPIEKEELEKAKAAGIEFMEIPVAFDGLTVVVNKENTFATDLTADELKKVWEPGSKINNWKDVRAGFPDMPMKLFGPGQDSGTFEYFTEAIVKQKKKSREDYSPSEDDNVLVNGVAGEKGGLGYFGYAYYVENKDKLTAVKVNGVEPNETTINDGTYSPLSRPLFIYVTTKAYERPEVKAFIEFMLDKGNRRLISESGYVALPDEVYELVAKHVSEKKTGTRFQGTQAGMKIADVLAAEKGQ